MAGKRPDRPYSEKTEQDELRLEEMRKLFRFGDYVRIADSLGEKNTYSVRYVRYVLKGYRWNRRIFLHADLYYKKLEELKTNPPVTEAQVIKE